MNYLMLSNNIQGQNINWILKSFFENENSTYVIQISNINKISGQYIDIRPILTQFYWYSHVFIWKCKEQDCGTT
jgi:hypothetical protein